jgi:hypothetical protein
MWWCWWHKKGLQQSPVCIEHRMTK